MLVFRPVSSRKTSRAAGHCGCTWRQCARAACSAGRSCPAARRVFLIAQAQPLQPVPERRGAQLLAPLLADAFAPLRQGEAGFLLDPPAKLLVVAFEHRAPVTAPPLAGHRAVLRLEVPGPLDAALAHAEAPRSRRAPAPRRCVPANPCGSFSCTHFATRAQALRQYK